MFCKDSRTENFLSQMGVEFQYTHQVKFSELSPAWDVVNLARPVPRREDAILEYATLMESGSSAPAPILHKSSGSYDVLDGVQRLAAAQLNGQTILAAYVVSCDSDNILSAIRVLANARLQGRAEPSEWTRRRAVEVLVIERHLSIEEVAKMGGWRPSEVAATAKMLDWGFQIRCIGGPQKLPDSVIDVISQHTTQEELKKAPGPISKFLNTLGVAQFSASDAEPHIEKFFSPISKDSRRHDIYDERLQEFMDEPECQTRIHGRKSAALSGDISLRRTLRAAVTILDQLIKDGDDLRYIDEFFKLTKDIDDKLHDLAKGHAKPVKVAVPADLYR